MTSTEDGNRAISLQQTSHTFSEVKIQIVDRRGGGGGGGGGMRRETRGNFSDVEEEMREGRQKSGPTITD